MRILILVLAFAFSSPAIAQTKTKIAKWSRDTGYVITRDMGGNVEYYRSKYEALLATSSNIVIDGECMSACTIVAVVMPLHRICVTDRAVLGFHGASVRPWGSKERRVYSAEETERVWGGLPAPIIDWINANGGMGEDLIYLKGAELRSIFQMCRKS